MSNDGVENIYWSGTETGLVRILEFLGIIYTIDGSKDNNGMEAGFYRHDTGQGGCCKVEEGLSSNRPEYAAAWLPLLDRLPLLDTPKTNQPVIILTDSLGLLTSIQNWIGEGSDPILRKSSDGEILRAILELLRKRMHKGLFTLFIQIKAHRGEFFKENADRWADKGRELIREAL